MSAKAISEYDGKTMLARFLANKKEAKLFALPSKIARIGVDTDLEQLPLEHPWLLTEKLVAKPDQLIKRRGKLGLLKINCTWSEARDWIAERLGREVEVGPVMGVMRSFVVEPFVPHVASDELYVAIFSVREGDNILFYHEGGIDVGDVDAKAARTIVPHGTPLTVAVIEQQLLAQLPADRVHIVAPFILALFEVYQELHFTYLEINPLVVVGQSIYYLDLAAKLDQAASFLVGSKWGEITFPAPFGRDLTPEERYVADLDAKTGASLKLTVLNPHGFIWTMVAGGGASVVYSDAIAALGYASEMANYGEYSGAPNESQTYEYAKTLLDLMTREMHAKGKVLIIGGGIANFTNVATTFKGIIRALEEYKHKLIDHKTRVYVRRGGPNYQEGLRMMRQLGERTGIPIRVYGPDVFITAPVTFALGKAAQIESFRKAALMTSQSFMSGLGGDERSLTEQAYDEPEYPTSTSASSTPRNLSFDHGHPEEHQSPTERPWYCLFTPRTTSFVFGLQVRAVQGMLDYDHMCQRPTASVAAIIYPFGGDHVQKCYWGTKEIMIPVITSIDEACARFPEADHVVNFSSFRSVYETTMQLLQKPQVRSISIIAEGVPEQHAKAIIKAAADCKVTIIGPATVGGIKPGCFKIGNTGGMMDNIVSSKLYRAGSVAYVSKSGGMSNELNNLVSLTTNGVYEGVAIGGDRYPGTSFIDHLLRFEADPECKMLVLLGEVGGTEEYRICEAMKTHQITKPLVAWCIGTCAGLFKTEVQFGHAGALANSDLETSVAKNDALRAAGAHVPDSFEQFPEILRKVYLDLVADGTIVPKPEPPAPKIPVDYAWAQELGLVRKPAAFVSTICDDRGEELLYAGMPISAVFQQSLGIGDVVSLLWFKRRLPAYASKFIEYILMLTADHGPAVSGAHNTIVTARAGRDLVSSLCAGLLTIGERFGGALDGAAQQFSSAYDSNLTPQQFLDSMRKKNQLIQGIGHRIKSTTNPDMRVTILVDYIRKHFVAHPILDYALKVEELTTAKKDNLILNVDGCIGVAFVDLMRSSGSFTREEADQYIKIGALNGLFIFARTAGFIGHYIDQKRNNQGLYRHPTDDITYC